MTGRIPIGTLCRVLAACDPSRVGELVTVVDYREGMYICDSMTGRPLGVTAGYVIEPDRDWGAPKFGAFYMAVPGSIEPLPPPPKALDTPRTVEAS